MPVAPASRLILRQSRFLLRRNNIRQASTTAETAAKAKDAATETASQAKSKAGEGLSRVTSSAGSIVSGAGAATSNALSKVGGRTGRYISFIRDSVIPPTIYYSRVGMELSRIVFKGQKMAPPSLSEFQSYFSPLANAARNPDRLRHFVTNASSSMPNPEASLNSIRNVSSQQLITLGVIGAEILGFFTVGTMMGRLKIVGYHGDVHHEH